MKICLISDTHCTRPVLPKADLLIHAGDLTRSGSLNSLTKEIEWLRELRDQFPLGVLFVPGNHDLGLDDLGTTRAFAEWVQDPSRVRAPSNGINDAAKIKELLKEAGITLLIDESIVIDGLHFYGSPMTRTFYHWAFMDSEDGLKAYWDKIPDEAQILITHGPPLGILDFAYAKYLGSSSLLTRLSSLPNLKAHVFGHIHEGAGHLKTDNTVFINAAVLDGRYERFNPTQVLDTDSWEVTVYRRTGSPFDND